MLATETYESARKLIGKGYPITLQWPGTKIQLFKKALPLTRVAVRYWLSKLDYNLAVLLKGSDVCVADLDSPEALAFVEKAGPVSNMLVKTRRGEHRYFRHDVETPANRLNYRVPGLDRLFNVATPAPPARIDATGHVYSFIEGPVPKDQLPLFPKHQFEEERRTPIIPLVSQTRAALLKYIGKIEAHSGSGGHGQAFRCACKIASQVEDIREGLAIFLAWNSEHAPPPFSLRECEHKISDAYKKKRT